MHAIADKLSPVRICDPQDEYRPFGAILDPRDQDLCSQWTIVTPEHVLLPAGMDFEPLSRTPREVFVGENRYFFKPLDRTGDSQFTRELKTYKAIEEAGLETLRISRLHMVVQGRDKMAYGLLLTFIDAEAYTLACAVTPSTPEHLRQRWAVQVTDTIHSLHRAGIVWGDVKPSNVLIDRDDNAWVIDFGGSYTEGWVEKELAETLQDDKQGLTRLLSYLRDESTLTSL